VAKWGADELAYKPDSVLLQLTIPATCPGDGLADLGQPGQCAYRLVGLNGDGEVRQCSVGVAENQDNFADEAESPINWSRSSHTLKRLPVEDDDRSRVYRWSAA
jgi:hypothetical protein